MQGCELCCGCGCEVCECDALCEEPHWPHCAQGANVGVLECRGVEFFAAVGVRYVTVGPSAKSHISRTVLKVQTWEYWNAGV